eukprot:3884593-Pyramimonas_sp.AAC.1
MEAKDMDCLFNATDDDDYCDYKKQLAEEVRYTAWGRSVSLREVLRTKIRERRQQGQELTDDQQRMCGQDLPQAQRHGQPRFPAAGPPQQRRPARQQRRRWQSQDRLGRGRGAALGSGSSSAQPPRG